MGTIVLCYVEHNQATCIVIFRLAIETCIFSKQLTCISHAALYRRVFSGCSPEEGKRWKIANVPIWKFTIVPICQCLSGENICRVSAGPLMVLASLKDCKVIRLGRLPV